MEEELGDADNLSFETVDEAGCLQTGSEDDSSQKEPDSDVPEVVVAGGGGVRARAKFIPTATSSPTVEPDIAITDDLIVLDETGSSSNDEGCQSDDGESGIRVVVADGVVTSSGKSDSDIEILDDSEAANGGSVAGPSSNGEDVQQQSTNEVSDAGESDVEEVGRGVSPACPCDDCPLILEMQTLLAKNKRLSAEIRKLKSRKCVLVECKNSVTVEVRFSEESLTEKYGEKMKTLVREMIDRPKKSSRQNSCNGDVSFCEDKSGQVEEPTGEKRGDTWRVPSYIREFSDVLAEDVAANSEEDLKKAPSARPRNSCWNCLGDHMLMECPQPRDQAKITSNRNEFMIKSGGQQQSSGRYHEDFGDDPKFSKYKPGKLSDELRRALGYSRYDVPFFIYKMRRLGYPPGWLMEAEVSSSGLTMYDSEGKEIAEPADDGEVEVLRDSTRIQYDPSLLVEYPGFNIKLPHGVIDNFKKYGFPPMQEHDMKSHLEKSIKTRSTYKRKKSLQLPSAAKRPKVTEVEEVLVDMEVENNEEAISPPGVDDFDDDCQFVPSEHSSAAPSPPVPAPDPEAAAPAPAAAVSPENPASAPLSEPATDPAIASADSAATPTPDPASGTSDDDAKTTTESTTPPTKERETAETTGSVAAAAPSSPTPSGSASPTAVSTPQVLPTSLSKSVCLGSPSLITASAYNLPPPEKFAVGVSEHIPFENLPDAVGSYNSKMKETIDKIRKYAASESS